MAKCKRFFSLAWYNNLTYASNKDFTSKVLLVNCFNKPSCQSIELSYIQLDLIIHIAISKVIEID